MKREREWSEYPKYAGLWYVKDRFYPERVAVVTGTCLDDFWVWTPNLDNRAGYLNYSVVELIFDKGAETAAMEFAPVVDEVNGPMLLK